MLTKLFKRSGVYFSGLVLSKVLSTLAFILYARQLLPTGFGEYIFFITLIQVITYFADVGLNLWYQKKYEESGNEHLFNKLLNVRLFTLAISILLAGPVLLLINPFSPVLILIFLATLIPEALLSTVDGYYLKKGNPLQVSLKNGSKMLVLLVGYFIFSNSFNVEIAVVLYLLASIFTLIWYFPWRELHKTYFLSVATILKTLRTSIPYAFLILTSFLYSRGDFLIIKSTLGSSALGIYDSAYRFLESINLIPTALAHNLFPISSKKEGIASNQLVKIFLTMTLAGIIVAACIYIFAELLITLLLGDAYLQAVPVLRILALVELLIFMNSPLSTIIQSSSMLKKFLPYGFGNTMLNLILNLIFLPLYGLQVAAWIMVLTEFLGLLINLYFIRKIYRRV